jgi:hypothetical protein
MMPVLGAARAGAAEEAALVAGGAGGAPGVVATGWGEGDAAPQDSEASARTAVHRMTIGMGA